VGRPTKLTPETANRIVQAVKAGATYDVAARAAGVSEATLYGWKARGAREGTGQYFEFLERVKRAEAEGELALMGHVATAMSTTWQAAAWMLERRWPDRWGRRDRVNVELRQDFERVSDSYGLDTDRLIAIAEGIVHGTDE